MIQSGGQRRLTRQGFPFLIGSPLGRYGPGPTAPSTRDLPVKNKELPYRHPHRFLLAECNQSGGGAAAFTGYRGRVTVDCSILSRQRKTPVLRAGTFGCLAGIPSVNVTIGCLLGCVYCYARGYPGAPGAHRVVLFSNLAQKLTEELRNKRRQPRAGSLQHRLGFLSATPRHHQYLGQAHGDPAGSRDRGLAPHQGGDPAAFSGGRVPPPRPCLCPDRDGQP